VVAVDLDGGRVAKDLDEARAIRNSLTDVEVLETTNDAKLLLREAYGSANRTGSIGFCMGGEIALKAACDLDFDFCIDYCGIMKEADKVSGLRGPLTLFLGSEDEKITPRAFDSLP
jgi:carboxymethylenebutenolidase